MYFCRKCNKLPKIVNIETRVILEQGCKIFFVRNFKSSLTHAAISTVRPGAHSDAGGRRAGQGRAEQGRETQHKKHCVTQCERKLRRRPGRSSTGNTA